ncbi:hypothetical protein LCGC14_2184340 [marine sediment metagenome]|uniref:Uncharacterized protein n=1 Tax=marine sediment metagenome TaxID=412755 RepID=A0A0F9E8F7_9ZZZZ
MTDIELAVLKTWQVGPYQDDWVVIVHAETRGQARKMGAYVDGNEFTEMRAIRLPKLDGKLITRQTLTEVGFPETWEGEPLDAADYILDCGCEICKASLREQNDRH